MHFLFILNLILTLLFLSGAFAGNCNSTKTISKYRVELPQTKIKIRMNQVTCKHGLSFSKKKNMKLDNKIKILFKTETRYLLGRGGTGWVFHTYMPSELKCIALKISQGVSKDELRIHKYFSGLPQEENNRIIKYYGSKRKKHHKRTFIALEYGGKTLFNYYNENKHQEGDNLLLLTNIIKSAARALAQFNQHAIHFDVKESNFVVSQEPDANIVDSVKIIDFHLSLLLINPTDCFTRYDWMNKSFMAPEIRGLGKIKNDSGIIRDASATKVDVWSFGLMTLSLLYPEISEQIIQNNYQIENEGYGVINNLLEQYHKSDNKYDLDRVIKACLQELPNNRPLIKTIVKFMINDCHGFNYERNHLRLENNQLWCTD